MTGPLSRRRLLRLGAAGLAAAVLAACAPEQTPPAETAVPSPDVLPSPTGSAPPAAEAAPEDRPFVASDPGSFQPAIGRPQLVEFFAFW